jgi:mannosyltransferase OCH1-like enzyme
MGDARMKIPRIIHRIWIEGSPPMPSAFVANGVRWAALNPGWTVRHWAGPDFRMRNACLYRRAPANDALRYRSDLLRLEILAREGGVYVDADMEPLRPLDELLTGHAAVAAYSPNQWKGERVLSNAFLAAVPGHPWILRCVEKMPLSIQAHRGQFLAMVTGPHHVNRCLRPGDDVHLLEPATLYPTTAAELACAYAFHAWANRARLKREALA